MPALTTDLLQGTFVVTVDFPADAERTDPAQIRSMLENFVLGIDFGFFDVESQSPALRKDGPEWDASDGQLRVRFGAQNLPRAAFTILKGMIAGLTQILGEEITSAVAQLEDSEVDLLFSSVQQLPRVGQLPFTADYPADGNLFKSLRIWLDFIREVPESERDGLIELFSVWDSLVLGPFPAEGRQVGESWAGPSMTSFLLPTRVEHFIEDYESGGLAFELLFRALLRLHKRLPIDEIEIE